MKNRHLWYTTE